MRLFRPLALAALTALGAAPLHAEPGAVRVQDDLYRHVNAAWLARTEIPVDKPEYGTFVELADKSDRDVRALLERLVAQPQAAGTVEQKLADYYGAYLDEAAIDRLGLAPLQPLLAEVQGLADRRALARWMGAHSAVLSLPLAFAVDADAKQPGINRPLVWQSGLGVPDRDYYLKRGDARFAKAVAAYRQYLETLARLAGLPDPAQAAADTLQLERQLAAAQWDKVALRDPQRIYNARSPAQLARSAPGLDWPVLLQAAGLEGAGKFVVGQPDYVAKVAALLARAPMRQWQHYLQLHLIDAQADVLPKAFRDARFAYRGQALADLQQDKPRWQQGIDNVNAALGEAVGRAYVAEHFPPEAKARMLTLVRNLLASFGDSIDGLSWMGPATKAKAKLKLSTYLVKIGYPDRWRDYSRLEVKPGDAFGNGLRAAQFEWARQRAKVEQPVDKTEWGMTPQTVNAYYNPTANEIVFPAAILQPPFFDMQADDAQNYGAIGAVIGHEISHGFDDEGSQFDHEGALKNWWTPADRKAFQKLGDQLVAQYGQYEPLPGKKLNGRLTLGENIADLSGLQIAFKAYQKSLNGQSAPVLNGLSGEQRFFHGWAQAWREKVREARSLQLLSTDPHSPTEFRANGAAVNHDGFHAAFGTRPGDKMFKPTEQRIRIW